MFSMGKLLLITGLGMAVLGLAFMALNKLPWAGKLPGDIHIERKNFSFHFPIATCIILSILLSILLNFFTRNR
jgi:hypothetical protein